VTTATTITAADATKIAPHAVTTRHLGKTIDDKRILADLTFTIAQGEYAALLGANGAGKSTLLKVLATLISPSHGEIELFGRDLRRHGARLRSHIGLIGHGAMLYGALTPLENLSLFGRLYGIADPTRRAMHLLETVGLADRALDPVKTFSRGMTQRASIARALMHNPDLLLADEPFAGLDAPSVRIVETLMASLHDSGKTVVLVNHDIRQSLDLAGHVIVMKRGHIVLDAKAAQTDAEAILTEVSSP
jgi:heme exporter protein A